MLHVQTKNGEVLLCTIIKNAFYYVYLHVLVYVAASYSVNKILVKKDEGYLLYNVSHRRRQQEQNGEGCIHRHVLNAFYLCAVRVLYRGTLAVCTGPLF